MARKKSNAHGISPLQAKVYRDMAKRTEETKGYPPSVPLSWFTSATFDIGTTITIEEELPTPLADYLKQLAQEE